MFFPSFFSILLIFGTIFLFLPFLHVFFSIRILFLDFFSNLTFLLAIFSIITLFFYQFVLNLLSSVIFSNLKKFVNSCLHFYNSISFLLNSFYFKQNFSLKFQIWRSFSTFSQSCRVFSTFVSVLTGFPANFWKIW